ncbi:DUF4244 domain-containing protein [Solicola gregarius]|uniref:DUF4244 domain-containing protein n=1 Tax=Solicola gregarius TaxID=2908642 RepID=A0AA46TDV8_9ACTN|nr:DUF4244 domain-containing protein [Solicola gregarius]UYM03370.1 DUF4244 domain-containing protein [Solicola gregarius]
MYNEKPAGRCASYRERGHATVEYAVGTVGAAGLAAALVQLAGSGWFYDLIQSLLRVAYGLPEFPTPSVLF